MVSVSFTHAQTGLTWFIDSYVYLIFVRDASSLIFQFYNSRPFAYVGSVSRNRGRRNMCIGLPEVPCRPTNALPSDTPWPRSTEALENVISTLTGNFISTISYVTDPHPCIISIWRDHRKADSLPLFTLLIFLLSGIRH